MWNSDKSIGLTHFFVRAFYAVLAAVAIAAPFLMENEAVYSVIDVARFLPKSYLIPFYITVPAGFAALVCLDKLLSNLKKEIVFESANVRLLRILSWCCVFVAGVTLITAIVLSAKHNHEIVIYISAIAEFFVGVIVCVVKNCFEKAVQIKAENDLTI